MEFIQSGPYGVSAMPLALQEVSLGQGHVQILSLNMAELIV